MSRFGRAVIEVLLRSEQARGDLKAVKQELADLKSKGGIAAESGLADEFAKTKQMIEGLRAASQGASTETAAIGSSIGAASSAASGLVSVISRLAWPAAFFVGVHELDSYLTELHAKAVAFKNALAQGVEPGQDRIHALREEIQGLTDVDRERRRLSAQFIEDEKKLRASALKANDGKPLDAEQQTALAAKIQENRENNRKALDELDNLLAKRAEQRQLDAESKFFNESRARTRDLVQSRLDGIDRVDERERQMLDDLARRRRGLDNPASRSQADEEEQAIRAAAEADRERERQKEVDRIARELDAEVRKAEADAKEERRQKEAAERVAKHAADVWRREMERAAEQVAAAIGRAVSAQQGFSNNSLNQITSDVTRIAQVIDMRLRANGIDMRR